MVEDLVYLAVTLIASSKFFTLGPLKREFPVGIFKNGRVSNQGTYDH